MITREELYKKFKRFAVTGEKQTKNGSVLIGNPWKEKPHWWLIYMYIQTDIDKIKILKKSTIVPSFYNIFLSKVANGLCIFFGELSLLGYREDYNRNVEEIQQPFDLLLPNVLERPENATNTMFFFGNYSEDGSMVYVDTMTNKIYRCAQFDVTPLYVWDNFDIFLETEIDRICFLYDDFGNKIDPNKSTLPI